MRLKKLELSGFKSFAKSTVLEFPSKITAIVGPNGSGKSNIKEAVQWVLGEQSMKSLRGKKGEDLIWNGSSQIPRMGKASVTLIFDNRDGLDLLRQSNSEASKPFTGKRFHMDFEEISLGRKIFRDGANEYYLNNSQVRLKDVVELIARMGLGETKHNIIGQGEVDRILLASPWEKREMLEEALGLRVYQLKKNETERKLEATQNNMKQVEALVREISPHLRFLRQQAEKHRTRESLETELKILQKVFLSKEKLSIALEKKNLEAKNEPLLKKLGEIKKEINQLVQQISTVEKKLSQEIKTESAEDRKIAELETKRRELERELGRLEGRLEIEKEKLSQPRSRVVDTAYVQEEIKEFISAIKFVLAEEEKIDEIKSVLSRLVKDMETLLQKIRKGTVEENVKDGENAIVRELQKASKSMQEELTKISREIEKMEGFRRQEQQVFMEIQNQIRGMDSALRRKRDEERNFSLGLERFRFDEERLKMREIEFHKALRDTDFKEIDLLSEISEEYKESPSEDLKKKIDRLHIKLEEVGGIDETVIKEFQDLEARHSFLSKELEDLKQAHGSLKELLKELDNHIKNNFKEGFSKIKEEFNKFFRVIFGGGKASLYLIKPVVRKIEEVEGLPSEALAEEGVEISVDLPRKRIKGLAMLSGGERALTSIALLFAISNINPPPFLILDETDAALDEANTQRYAAMLKELSQKTQLILVTHNRETMKAAGVLYGVTMGDDGMSKLLSLKLEEAEVYTNS